MKKCYKYEDDSYEIFVENQVYIKNKIDNEYYRGKISDLNEDLLNNLVEYKARVNRLNFLFFCFSFTLLLVSNLVLFYFSVGLSQHTQNWYSYIPLTLYLIINIILHEIGHIFSLKHFGRKHNKIGFKMNYLVFPSVYVQINESYLLSKREKLIVHSSGVLLNLFIIGTTQLINISTINSTILTYSYLFFFYALLWNIIPVLNSDGYKVLLVLLDIDELENKKSNHWLIKSIQIVGVILALRALAFWLL